MVTRWNTEFDRVCGSEIRTRFSAPLVDSEVHDWLHGKAEPLWPGETETIAFPVRKPLETGWEANGTGGSVPEKIVGKQT